MLFKKRKPVENRENIEKYKRAIKNSNIFMNFIFWGYKGLPNEYDFYLKTFLCRNTEELCDFNIAFLELADRHRETIKKVEQILDLGEKNFLLKKDVIGLLLSELSQEKIVEEIQDDELKNSIKSLNSEWFKTISLTLKSLYMENF